MENVGLIFQFPWDDQHCMALNFSLMSLPTAKRFFSVLCSKICCHFKLNSISQNEEQNTSQLINFKNGVNLPENITLAALAVKVK